MKNSGLILWYTCFIIPPWFQMTSSSCNGHRKQRTFLPATSGRAGRSDREYPVALSHVWLWHFIIQLTWHIAMIQCVCGVTEQTWRACPQGPRKCHVLHSLLATAGVGSWKLERWWKMGPMWTGCSEKGTEDIIRSGNISTSNSADVPLLQPLEAF